MTTTTALSADAELQLALAAVLAGHHDARQAGRDRAGHVRSRLTHCLSAVAIAVAVYDLLLIVV